MHNPFVLLSAKLLDSLIKAGNTHFVRQTYKRGKDELHDHFRADGKEKTDPFVWQNLPPLGVDESAEQKNLF